MHVMKNESIPSGQSTFDCAGSRRLLLRLSHFAQVVGVTFALSTGLVAQYIGPKPTDRDPTLEMQVALGFSDDPEPQVPSRPPLNVPPGTTIKLRIRAQDIVSGSVVWTKNAATFATTNEMELPHVSSSDSGIFGAHFATSDGKEHDAASIVIRVVTPVRQQLLNLSSRTTISPSNPVLISGLVIAPRVPGLAETKKILIRAIGPSLARFGVKQPLASPTLRIFYADGSEMKFYPPQQDDWPRLDLVPVEQAVGAFPRTTGSNDVALIFSLSSGVYTVHVSSADGGTGDVLLETYEVPEDVFFPFIYPLPPPQP